MRFGRGGGGARLRSGCCLLLPLLLLLLLSRDCYCQRGPPIAVVISSIRQRPVAGALRALVTVQRTVLRVVIVFFAVVASAAKVEGDAGQPRLLGRGVFHLALVFGPSLAYLPS